MLRYIKRWLFKKPVTNPNDSISSQEETISFNALPPLVLYKFDACPYCKRVQRKIDTLLINNQIEMRDTRDTPMWRKDLLSRTGRTQVPCLFIDGKAMFESLDIIAYLEDRFGKQ